MTIYKRGTRKYYEANRTYRYTKARTKKRAKKKVSKYDRLKTNLSKWFYGRMGLLN